MIVLETAKGTIELETYPEEAPKTVSRVLDLVKKNFYNGQRFHRAEPKFLVQIGDPVSRDMSREEWWGRQGTGKPIGVAEVTRKRAPVLGAVGMAYPGTDRLAADSQFFISPTQRTGARRQVHRLWKGPDGDGRCRSGAHAQTSVREVDEEGRCPGRSSRARSGLSRIFTRPFRSG